MSSSQEETFGSLMDYFTGRRMKILTSNSPSYIRAEIGSWASMSFGNAKGEVEVNITKRNSGCYVNLNFTFLKEYIAVLIVSIIAALTLYGFVSLYLSGFPRDFVSIVQGPISLIMFGGIVSLFAAVLAVSGYSTSRTRRNFIEELNMFVQSLSAKKKQ